MDNAKVVETNGDFHVVELTLTDGSKVYDVEFRADTGEQMRITCRDGNHAFLLARALHSYASDVSVLGVPA